MAGAVRAADRADQLGLLVEGERGVAGSERGDDVADESAAGASRRRRT